MSLPEIYMLILFGLGAFVMRSAGCIINDIFDREIDARVQRTKNRPLASGEISTGEAWVLFIFMMFFGLIILMQLNSLTIKLGFAIVIPIILYPLAKRVFAGPQLFLAIVFNWGVIMGWAAVAEDISSPIPWLLYVACMCWTLGYDTIYAHQDKVDDKKMGIGSTAVAFGNKTKLIIAGLYSTMFTLLLVVGWLSQFSKLYYTGIIIAGLHLLLQVRTVDLNNGQSCMDKFKSNVALGWIIFITLFIEKAIQF
jgi:4-hydroxybenzoate polyprenyl transferase